ncbi:MAG: SUF system NifU family Fe-S cluster assembly protein [Phycisphaerales bacterium]|nr:MAG: SUF system NifU family Fe-S cluster assembly protein [Phycisphaerales bacterium]
MYQELILDHNRSPRNRRVIEAANRKAEGYNPLCGDRVTVTLVIDENNVVQDIAFQGAGCAISTASASLMTETLKGKTVPEARAILDRFHAMVTGEPTQAEQTEEHPEPEGAQKSLGKLKVFSGVSEYPARVKCATLAWHTLKAALEKQDQSVTTE